MKSKLILVSTKDMTNDEWLAYRKTGIGASDVATVMGLNPYKSSIEFFYEQINQGIKYNVENMAMFLGTEQEEFVAKLWQYWEGSEESIINNYRAGRIVRRCRRVNAYVRNPDYPWLFVSLDRKIDKTDAVPEEGALEIKTMAGYSADKWEHGIPPAHVVQVQTQTAVCEFSHGELATMVDGRKFDCLPFSNDWGVCESILKITGGFWERILEARKITTQLYEAKAVFNYRLSEKLEGELQQLEPPPDGSDAYLSFLKEKYKIADPGERSGTPEQFEVAQKHAKTLEEIKKVQATAAVYESQLKNVFRDDFDKMTFGEKGYVSWKTNVKGSRVLLNKTKV